MACEKCSVWQHSACLGISQAEAERDDFHFVCRDCLRRAEDAAKPKIPPLRFHFGSSSSPPAAKSDHEPAGSKKRKSTEENGQLPPLKKFKPVEVHPPPPKPYFPGQIHTGQNGMHKVFMTGPALSSQGQIQRPTQPGRQESQATVSPGLGSPPALPAYTNGYHSLPKAPPSNQAALSPVNGMPSINSTHTTSGWSERYTPAHTPRTYHQSSPSSQNPFHNSFDRQRPGSSHSSHNAASPIKNRSTTSSLPKNHNPTPAFSPYTNGISSHPNLPAAQPPPVKHQTSPPPPPNLPPSSSPTNYPSLQNTTPSSPGFSPTKQSPPQRLSSHHVATTPVLPPVAALMPSPEQPHHHGPMKRTTPELPKIVNGDSYS